MRRRLFVVIAVVVFMGIVGGASTYAMALNAPYVPGDAMFSLQLVSERLWGLTFNGNERVRTETLLILLARRLDELTVVKGTPDELTAVSAIERTYDEIVTTTAKLPESEQQSLQTRLARLSQRAINQLNELNNAQDTAILAFIAKLESGLTPEQMLELETAVPTEAAPEPTATVSATATAVFVGNQLDDPRFVPFPPDADILEAHSFFALTGGHSDQLCSACHTGGTYGGTPTKCVACHADDDKHAGNFGLNCALCHTINTWQEVVFDHSVIGTQDCVDCHAPPENHYPGACRACHTDTTDFNIVFFDHTVVSDQDCAVCHLPPENHYQGACRLCHTDTTDFRIAFFNHVVIGGTDCVACHAAPANHYTGACNACHQDTSNFRNANFNHAGLTDCAACHAPPANHFPGQCSNCHNTNTFAGATFNHSFPIYHGDANGQCATCHPGNDTRTYTCYNCHNQQKMISEHSEEGIGDLSNCTRCHADGREHDD